jgi:hypothetical protein
MLLSWHWPIACTSPNEYKPNYVFETRNELWNRCELRAFSKVARPMMCMHKYLSTRLIFDANIAYVIRFCNTVHIF